MPPSNFEFLETRTNERSKKGFRKAAAAVALLRLLRLLRLLPLMILILNILIPKLILDQTQMNLAFDILFNHLIQLQTLVLKFLSMYWPMGSSSIYVLFQNSLTSYQ